MKNEPLEPGACDGSKQDGAKPFFALDRYSSESYIYQGLAVGFVQHDGLCHQGVARFARKAVLADKKLLQAARDVAAGRYDADLGGGVFKQRVAREGGGRSGGFRTIILFRFESHSFFAHGFAKSDKANVSAKELKALKQLAETLLGFSNKQLEAAKSLGGVDRGE